MVEQATELEEVWKPRTLVGRLVLERKITSIDEIFRQGLKIREPEIVDMLLPNLQQEVLGINLVQRQTDAGERSRFKAIVAVGDGEGHIGIGSGKARQVRAAIEKAVLDAKLNIIPVRRGCGSWECGCDKLHSLPFKVTGKCGSVRVVLIPGPRGLGLVAGEAAKVVLRLAGISDCWTRTYGSTSTLSSFSTAIYNALKNTYRMVTPADWAR